MATSRRAWHRAWSLACVLALVLAVLLDPPNAQAYHIVTPPSSIKEMRPRPRHTLHHRRHALQHVAGVATGLLFGGALITSSAWAGDSSGGRKGLVNLLRIRAYIVTLKETLQELLDKGEKSAPAEINQQIKYLVRTIRMAESIQEAAVLVEGGDRARDAARSAGRSGYEYLTQVIEFSGFEDMKRDGVSKYATLSSPERIEFALKCLTAADAGMELAVGGKGGRGRRRITFDFFVENEKKACIHLHREEIVGFPLSPLVVHSSIIHPRLTFSPLPSFPPSSILPPPRFSKQTELGRYFRFFPPAVLADAHGIYESYFLSGG